MKQLIFNFHGVGEAPQGTDASERRYWWDERPFVGALDRISDARKAASFDIVITFDDGNMSDVAIALPALVKRGLTAEFFVCAGRVGKESYLDRAAIHDLLEAGMGVGSHGMNHVDWRHTSEAELNDEIPGAIERLEQLCGRPIVSASIPFGAYDRRIIANLRKQRLCSVYSSDGGYARPHGWLKSRNSLDRSWQDRNFLAGRAGPHANLQWLRRNLSIAYKMSR